MNKVLTVCLLVLLQACQPTPTEIVQQEKVEVSVSASGELESKKTAVIAPPSVTRMWQYQIKFLLPENTRVKQGDMIVSFDAKKITERLVDKQSALNRAQKELDNKEIKEVATEQELVLKVAEKQMEFEKSQRKAEIVDNSRSDNDRKKAEIDFTIAENDLFLAQEKLKFHRSNKALNLKLARGKVNRLSTEIKGLNKDVARLKVKAPIDGMVIYRSNWQGEKPAVGENVQFGQPIIELAVVEEMQLKAQIAEPDSGKVKLGQKVKVTLDGTQELVFQGKIISLGRVFRDKSFQDKRRIFDAIIEFDSTDTTVMRPGMTARVEVVTQVLDNALILSSAAIKHIDGKNIVTLTSMVGDKQQEIEVAHVIGNKVVIDKGLSQGDVVAL
jgi:HlyD family secretion protein